MTFSTDLAFGTRDAGSGDATSYRLLELSPDLLKLFEQGDLPPGSLSIRGGNEDDAVLCTPTSTFAIRSVDISNSLVLVSPTPSVSASKGHDALFIREELHEILEVLPTLPRLDGLIDLLRGANYSEVSQATSSTPKVTYEYIRAHVQASDAELKDGLEQARVLTVNGHLVSMNTKELALLLRKIMNTIVFLQQTTFVPTADLEKALSSEHGISNEVGSQLVGWFGTLEEAVWEPDYEKMAKVIGLDLLSEHKAGGINEGAFMKEWRHALGDAFEEHASLTLLTGNYLSTTPDGPNTGKSKPSSTLWYFPLSELPKTPSERFKELFLVRAKWRATDIIPFLDDVTMDAKGRDKLLLKHCRASTDESGDVWYTGRGNY